MFLKSISLALYLTTGLISTTACRRPGPTPTTYKARIGVAIQLPGRICLSIQNSKLIPGADFTIIAPGDPTKNRLVYTARVQIISKGAPCPGANPEAALTNYNLELTNGTIEPNAPVIALDARVPSVAAAHSFHSCNSEEGVHLTAWDGAKPLEGHRLWSQYYDLGRDLQPNCTAPELIAAIGK